MAEPLHVDQHVWNADWIKVVQMHNDVMEHELAALMDDDDVDKSALPRDADADGWIYEGTKRKRPAPPSVPKPTPGRPRRLPKVVQSRDKKVTYEKVQRAPASVRKITDAQAAAKIRSVPKPSAKILKENMASLARWVKEGRKGRAGGEFRGNSTDRKRSRQRLFIEFGGDKRGYVPCVHCGMKLHWSNDQTVYPVMERDKILVLKEGGRYRHENLLPACAFCNGSRGEKEITLDTPDWKKR